MFTLEDRLGDVRTKDLLRAYNSSKEYIKLEFSVFNAGAFAVLKCSDRYTESEDNGMDFILCNDSEIHYTLKEILINRLKRINESWTKRCYYEEWGDFLRDYGLTKNAYKRLLKLENN